MTALQERGWAAAKSGRDKDPCDSLRLSLNFRSLEHENACLQLHVGVVSGMELHHVMDEWIPTVSTH